MGGKEDRCRSEVGTLQDFSALINLHYCTAIDEIYPLIPNNAIIDCIYLLLLQAVCVWVVIAKPQPVV